MDDKAAADGHHRNRPTMVGPSSASLHSWEIHDNPIFYDHGRCRGCRNEEGERDYLKAELDRERRLRAIAEAQRDSSSRDAEVERAGREAAERRLGELERELRRAREEIERRAAPAACLPAKAPPEVKGNVGADLRRRSEQQRSQKEAVENPHIRRGIVGFVEFPRIMRNRKGGGARSDAPNLECQKAQFRVLLKSNRVSPVGGVRGTA